MTASYAAQGPEQLTPKGRRSRPFPLCTRPPSGHFAPLMVPSAPRSRCPSVKPPRSRQSLRRHARRHDLWRERHICQTCQRAAGSGCPTPIPLPSVRRLRVVLCEFTNTTHKHTQTHRPAAENALELTIDLRGAGVAVEEWMRGGRHGGKGETTGSESGGESARCRGCQGDAPRGPGARWRRRGGRLLAVRRRPEPAKTRRAAAQSEAGRGAGEWAGFKVQGVG